MRKLSKTAKPQILVDNEESWTRVLTDKLARGEDPTEAEKTRYRHVAVKLALIEETNNKCAYCESKLQHIHHGDVEHITPKSLEPSKTVTWENLTLACEVCNQNKSNLDPYANEIIDPYITDPRAHLKFQGALLFSLGTVKGHATKAIFDLDRPKLVEERGERLKFIMGIFENVLREDFPLPARRAILKNLLERDASVDKAFSAMADDAIEAMLPHVPAEVRRGIR